MTLPNLIISFAILMLSSMASAKTAFPDTIKVGEVELVKNGQGVRKVSVFIGNVSVYVIALYLTKKETNPDAILKSDEVKVLKMLYHYDVNKSKIVNAWKTSFEKNCGECKALKAEIDKFLGVEEPCASGTVRTIDFLKDKMVIYHNKKTLFETTNKEFAKLILATWLGAHPPTEEVKKSLLGLK